jgi:hypothetical protein
MKTVTAVLLGFFSFGGVQTASISSPLEPIKLMSSYEWSALNTQDESSYVNGALESFFFRLYSSVDDSNLNQVRHYRALASCVETQRSTIQQSLKNLLAVGRGLEESFPALIWNDVVPVVCERNYQPSAGRLKSPLRFVSHYDWQGISQKQKKLFLQGYLEAQLHLVMREPDSKQKSETLGLFKQLTSDAGQKKILDLLDENGLEPDVPIPWSIARASGSVVKRGPGYPYKPSTEDWTNRVSKDLIEGWGSWIDLEAVNAVCLEKWRRSGAKTFKESLRAEVLRQHKCVAEKIATPLLPKFFADLGVPSGEIVKMQAQLSPTMIQEKTRMAKNHFSALPMSAQEQLCADNWERITSPALSMYFRAHQMQYDLNRVSGASDAAKLAGSLITACKIPAP